MFRIPLGVHSSSGPRNPLGTSEAAPIIDHYIGDQANRLACYAYESFKKLDPRWSPLLLFGPQGTGKSSLATGLIDQISQANPPHTAISMAGADFARAYAAAVETNSVADFRSRFEQCNICLIDNIHELSGKFQAQQELVKILDGFQLNQQFLIATSSSYPAGTKGVAPNLASRLASGLTVPMVAPGLEARLEILKQLAHGFETEIDEDALQLLARRLDTQFAHLKHSIIHLCRQSQQCRTRIDYGLAKKYLLQRETENAPSLKLITSRVARSFNLKSSDLTSSSRRQPIVRARGVAMYLARDLTQFSLEKIGKHFGGRDHTTVLHACKRTEALLDHDGDLRMATQQIMSMLGYPA